MVGRSRLSVVYWIASAYLAAATTLLVLEQTYAQDGVSSSYGKDFYIGFMPNIGGSSFTSLRLLIGTTAESADYVVEVSERVINEGTVSAGIPALVDIPSDPRDLELQVTDSDFSNRKKGIHVYTTDDDLISVIAENFVTPFNHGVFLAYPCITIETDTDYEYYVISTGATDFARSQFLLVGCEDNTTITVTPTQSVSLPQDPQMATSASITVEPETTSQEFTLNQMQTLLVTSANDLTRTKIVSNKPLTVISGHECANVPFSESGCEPLAFHVPPSTTWRTRFLLAPFAGRTGVQSFKMISAETTTIIYTCGSISRGAPNITNLQLNTDEYCYLESSKPLLVVQLSPSGSTDMQGDPAITMISPIDQYVNEIAFLSLPTSSFPSNYISVTVPAEHYNPNKILLDGVAIDCDWKEIQNTTNDIVGYGCSKTVSSGRNLPMQHNVSHIDADQRISVLVYGFSASPGRGYAYLTGQQILLTNGDGEEIVITVEFLPFVDLTEFPGVKELNKSVPDATSEPVFIPDGLIFGDKIVTSAYINENGVISFDRPWKYSYPDRFPTEFYYTRQGLAVAPFWSDNDIRKEGAVRYATYCTSQECTTSPEGKAQLSNVNEYIQSLQEEGEPKFIGKWLLVVHWDHVHPSPHGEDDHKGIPEDELNKFNNYQAIVVSDVLRTFVVFSYMCGEIQWSALGRNRAAVVGFNAEGNIFGNHPLSGFPAVGDAVSCTFDLGKRRKRQDMTPNNMGMELPADERRVAEVEMCLNAFGSDELLVADPEITISDLSEMLGPCPCTKRQADLDFGQFRQQDDLTRCYHSMNPVEFQLRFSGVQITLTQQCCYDINGALQTSPNEGFAGTMLLHHPVFDTENYNNTDKAFRDACCEISSDEHCRRFFQQRIMNNCTSYSPPALAIGHGDPHYMTFDVRYYTFNGLGDFTHLEVLPAAEVSEIPVFTLQGRLGRVTFRSVTIFLGIAFGHPNLAFQFGMAPGFRVFQTRPEPSTEITALLQNGQPWDDATGNARLTRNGNSLKVAFYQSGVTLVGIVYQFFGQYYINVFVYVPSSFSGRIRGLWGNLDGNSDNDFYRKGDTTPLPNGISPRNLYQNLLTWEVSDGESLFFNAGRRKRQTAPDADFIPTFFDELNITEAERIVCEDNDQCLFDLAATGDMTFALTTLDHQKEANATKEVLSNFPPSISAAATFRVNVGEESVFTLYVVDPGDEFTLNIEGGLPENSVLEEITDGEYAFRWNLQQITTEPLVFIANDTRGAASIFIPTVEVCACSNGGNCTLDGVLNNNATVVLDCLCSDAFTGRFCEEDRNGCSEIQCFEGVECFDVPAPGVGAVCGACPQGYAGDAQKCYDTDECSLNDTLCQQICVNTDGDYFCSCMEGYRLIEGTNQCEDINECGGVNDCQQLCMNTLGTYKCGCSEGFTLADDGRNCTADVPCGGGCSFGCAIVNGEEQCYCPIGFELSIPGRTQCVDRDECETSPCEHMCSNTEGSFECTCRTGYELQEDVKSCEDIDECLEAAFEAMDLCESDKNSQCVNTVGSFDCVCVPGYVAVNGTCERIVNEPPPPLPLAITPSISSENSVNFTSPTMTLETFTPDQQQKFRKVTAAAVVNFCSMVVCNLVLSDGKMKRVIDLKVDPANIAIPTSLIRQNEEGQLQFTVYIQLTDSFLSKIQLQLALMQADEQFRDAGFLDAVPVTTEMPTDELPTTTEASMSLTTTEDKPQDCPPYCTVEYCSDRPTRTSLCTLPNPQHSACEAKCRLTYCHTCYYADEHRPLPGSCATCSSYPEVAQLSSKCFKRWAVCVRRSNGGLYHKARKRERTQERFKCYEHPCV